MSDKVIMEEVHVMGDVLTPGRKFKVDSKQSRTLFEFRFFVIPAQGLPYIEARDLHTGGARSISLDRVAKVVAERKPRKKRSDG